MTITPARAVTLGASMALALTLGTATADDFEESYWYALGDPTLPDGQLWTTSYGECWQSAYPDGPTNLPPCMEPVPESISVQVNFEFDKYGLDDIVNPGVLTQIDDYIEKVQGTPQDEFVTVVGHTDAKGSEAYNYELGLRRAETIRDYIIAQGYPADQVSPFSVDQRRVVITRTVE
jgi:OOP family OmpA-OmpF porin